MSDDPDRTDERIAELEREISYLRMAQRFERRFVRRRSKMEILGLPLWEVAIGPDPARGQRRGHAKAIFAFGDIATGVFACGGIARGLFAFGGVAIGGVTFGGLSLGLLVAVGGAAVGGIAAGGAAVGYIALGGAALGYYAIGGGEFGAHVLSGARQDPVLVDFFQNLFR